jgi:PAS domain-containing protein
MQPGAWMKEFPAAITVCDAGGVILEMNDQACKVFAKDGGRDLVGRNVLDCHPEPARNKLQKILDEQLTNCYTTEKNGVRKLIYQAPWYEGQKFMGMVEVAIELPADVPQYIR